MPTMKPSVALNRSTMCGGWEAEGRVSLWGNRHSQPCCLLLHFCQHSELPEAALACQERWVYPGDYCNNALAGKFQDFNSLLTITSQPGSKIK